MILKFEKKVELIDSTNITQVEIIREFGLRKFTVNTIWKDRENYVANSHSFGNDTKRLRKAAFDEVENALLLWLKQARTYGTPVGGPLLKQKANELAAELGHEGSTAAMAGHEQFKKKKRNNLSHGQWRSKFSS